MKLEASVSSLADLPVRVGAHDLAWSYLMDAVMADAYRFGLSALYVSLPMSGLEDELRLRARFSQVDRQGGAVGAALLGSERDLAKVAPVDATRLYSLEFGVLAAPHLRRVRSETRSWQLEAQLSVYCLAARLWGGPIRATALIGRADLSDRAMFAMRHAFVKPHRCAAFYHLSTWSRA